MSIASLSTRLVTHANGVTGTKNSFKDSTAPAGLASAQLPAWICFFEALDYQVVDFGGRGPRTTYTFRHRLLYDAVGQSTLGTVLGNIITILDEYADDLAANPFLSDTGAAGIGRVQVHIVPPGVGQVDWAGQSYFGSDIMVIIEEVF